MNTIEAAALQAIREYYGEHRAWHDICSSFQASSADCVSCRKARTFAGLIGVDLDKEDEA